MKKLFLLFFVTSLYAMDILTPKEKISIRMNNIQHIKSKKEQQENGIKKILKNVYNVAKKNN